MHYAIDSADSTCFLEVFRLFRIRIRIVWTVSKWIHNWPLASVCGARQNPADCLLCAVQVNEAIGDPDCGDDPVFQRCTCLPADWQRLLLLCNLLCKLLVAAENIGPQSPTKFKFKQSEQRHRPAICPTRIPRTPTWKITAEGLCGVQRTSMLLT